MITILIQILKFYFGIFNIEGYLEAADIPHDSKNDTLLGSRNSGMVNVRKSVLVSIKLCMFNFISIFKICVLYIF